MPKTRIPSPARSQGAPVTPRRQKPRTLSVGSPARSNASTRLSSVIDQYRENSFALSPLGKTVLNDETDIEQPRRASWWKRVDHSRVVSEVLDTEKGEVNNVFDELEIEVLSQEKKDYTMDLPESSDSESISSIVIPQRRLFSQKENIQQNLYREIVKTRESLAKQNKTNIADKTATETGPRNLFNKAPRRTKPIFPAALLNFSPDKTANKTKELPAELKGEARNLFGNRPGTKRKNMFNDFILSESEDDISDIQPKLFAFQKNSAPVRHSTARPRETSPTSSIATDIEMDDWHLLPSSTMVEQQIEALVGNTPGNRSRLSKLSEAKESTVANSTANKTKHSNKSASKNNGNDDLNEIANEKTNVSLKGKPKAQVDIITENHEKQHDNIETSEKKSNKSKSINKYVEETPNATQEENKDDENNEKIQTIQEKSKNTNQEMEVSEHEEKRNNEVANKSKNEIETNQKQTNKNYENEKKVEEIETGEHVVERMEDNKREVDKQKMAEQTIKDQEIDHDKLELAEQSIGDQKIVDAEQEMAEQAIEDQEIEDDEQEMAEKAIEGKEIENDEQEMAEQAIEDQGIKDNEQEMAEQAIEDQGIKDDEQEMAEQAIEDQEIEDDEQEVDEQEMPEQAVDDPETDDNEEDADEQEIEVSEQEIEDEQVEEEEMVLQMEDDDDIENDTNEIEKEVSDNEEQYKSQEVQDENQEENNSQKVHDQSANISVNVENDEKDEKIESDNEEEIQNESQNIENDSQEMDDAEVENDDDEQDAEEQDGSDEELDESQEVLNESQEQEIENTSQDIQEQSDEENDADIQNESAEVEEENNEEIENESHAEINNDSQEVNDDQEDIQNESQDVSDGDQEDNEEEEGNEDDQEAGEQETEEQQETKSETPNVSHDTTGRNRKNDLKSPEAILHEVTNETNSFTTKGRNTSIRNTKSIFKTKHSLAPTTESTRLSDGTTNSSAEGSGWDSHRTTRKTLRQTFGRDFTPRKSLRAMVMEKSAKRQTAINEANAALHSQEAANAIPPEDPQEEMDYDDNDDNAENIEESDHEVSKRTRQTTLEMYLQKIKKENIERKLKIEEQVNKSLKFSPHRRDFLNRTPPKPIRRTAKPLQIAPKKRMKRSVISLEDLPPELVMDMKYKPPKRYQPNNASWVTKRLYKFLESKLEPVYDYKARVRAEKLVQMIYKFAQDTRRGRAAAPHAVAELKWEMARLHVVRTHFDFYNFFHDYMPLEVKIKVVPDIVNDIPMPRNGLFGDIMDAQ